jgi:hypothetical protein
MDPLTPNDPLWKVLGAAKRAEPRPNFVANVVRQARHTAQERGLLARVRAWFLESHSPAGQFAWAGVAAAVVTLAALLVLHEPAAPPLVVEALPVTAPASEAQLTEADLPPASVAQWADMEQFGSLLAVYDASLLTDREINELLY